MFERLAALEDCGPAIRIHGDMHLGQVMRTDTGWFVLDFGGEPSRPVEERRMPTSPMKDVAGMLRSLHYATWTAAAEQEEQDQVAQELAHEWEQRNRGAFVDGYLKAAREAGGLLPDRRRQLRPGAEGLRAGPGHLRDRLRAGPPAGMGEDPDGGYPEPVLAFGICRNHRPEFLELAGHEVTVTNPDKIFFPEIGVTKLDLVNYYLAVAPGAIRGVYDRPTSLKRFPNGADGDFFFQKRVPTPRPEWIQTAIVRFPSGRSAEFLTIVDEAHLVWADQPRLHRPEPLAGPPNRPGPAG